MDGSTVKKAILCDRKGESASYENATLSPDSTAESQIITITITNTPGVELPMTGGAGTATYAIPGAALMGIAAALLAIKRLFM